MLPWNSIIAITSQQLLTGDDMIIGWSTVRLARRTLSSFISGARAHCGAYRRHFRVGSCHAAGPRDAAFPLRNVDEMSHAERSMCRTR